MAGQTKAERIREVLSNALENVKEQVVSTVPQGRSFFPNWSTSSYAGKSLRDVSAYASCIGNCLNSSPKQSASFRAQ